MAECCWFGTFNQNSEIIQSQQCQKLMSECQSSVTHNFRSYYKDVRASHDICHTSKAEQRLCRNWLGAIPHFRCPTLDETIATANAIKESEESGKSKACTGDGQYCGWQIPLAHCANGKCTVCPSNHETMQHLLASVRFPRSNVLDRDTYLMNMVCHKNSVAPVAIGFSSITVGARYQPDSAGRPYLAQVISQDVYQRLDPESQAEWDLGSLSCMYAYD
jgi:hypothetical protein